MTVLFHFLSKGRYDITDNRCFSSKNECCNTSKIDSPCFLKHSLRINHIFIAVQWEFLYSK